MLPAPLPTEKGDILSLLYVAEAFQICNSRKGL